MFDNLKPSSSSSGFENWGFLTQIPDNGKTALPFSAQVAGKVIEVPAASAVLIVTVPLVFH